MGARILHVDLDAFFVEVCRQRHPELREVELLVVGGQIGAADRTVLEQLLTRRDDCAHPVLPAPDPPR